MTEYQEKTELAGATPTLKVSGDAGDRLSCDELLCDEVSAGDDHSTEELLEIANGSPPISQSDESRDTSSPLTDPISTSAAIPRSVAPVRTIHGAQANPSSQSQTPPGLSKHPDSSRSPKSSKENKEHKEPKAGDKKHAGERFGRKQILMIIAMTIGSFLACLIPTIWSCFNDCFFPTPSSNALAVGADSKVKESITLPVNPPAELDGLTKNEVLNLRKAYADRLATFLAVPYQPFVPVFKCLEDKRPWWGMKGYYWNGPGEKSMEGPSREGESIANPLLLVVADWRDVPQWNRAKIGNPDEIQNFPYKPEVEQVTFDPSQKKMEITYNLTAFKKRLSEVNGWSTVPEGLNSKLFLTDYNARDFGYNYKTVAVESPSANATQNSSPVRLFQFVHGAESCGIPCNNLGQFNEPDVAGTPIAVPGRIHVKLWKSYPASYSKANAEKRMPETPPDFNVHLLFK